MADYLEDLVARIDVPLLQRTYIRFFNQLVFDISQFPNLIYHTEKFTVLNQVDVVLYRSFIGITLSRNGATIGPKPLDFRISCKQLDWQLSALAQVCNSCLPTLHRLEHLSIRDDPRLSPHWQGDMENTQWLELLHPFTTVKNLYLSKDVALYVASALQDLSEERATEVLPALQHIFIDRLQPSGSVQEVFHKFVTACGRQASGRPVAIHSWVRQE
jgi:hypothetical protein